MTVAALLCLKSLEANADLVFHPAEVRVLLALGAHVVKRRGPGRRGGAVSSSLWVGGEKEAGELTL